MLKCSIIKMHSVTKIQAIYMLIENNKCRKIVRLSYVGFDLQSNSSPKIARTYFGKVTLTVRFIGFTPMGRGNQMSSVINTLTAEDGRYINFIITNCKITSHFINKRQLTIHFLHFVNFVVFILNMYYDRLYKDE